MQAGVGSSFNYCVRYAGGVGDIGDERSLDIWGVADLERLELPALDY